MQYKKLAHGKEMKLQSDDLRKNIAFHYYEDALDFLYRFDHLVDDYSKTKRMKCFVDLLMGFECILKCHIFLSNAKDNMIEIYQEDIRGKGNGHDLSRLADEAKFLPADVYQEVKVELGPYNVFARYSLDGYANFIPSYVLAKDAKFNYSETLANTDWINKKRNLYKLIDNTSSEVQGDVSMDLQELERNEQELMDFLKAVKIIK